MGERLGERPDGPGVALDDGWRERLGRQLDDEGGRPGEAVVLPAGRAPRVALEAPYPGAGQMGVAANEHRAATGEIDEPERLVVPNRDRGTEPVDEGLGGSGLRL